MKKTLLLFFVLVSIGTGAQTDSSMQANTIAIQIRDAKFLIGTQLLHPNDTLFKVAYDSISAKIRRDPNATETNNLTIPIRPKALLKVNEGVRLMQHGTATSHYTRLNTAFRAITGAGNIGRTWLTIRMDRLDAAETTNDTLILTRATNQVLGEQ